MTRFAQSGWWQAVALAVAIVFAPFPVAGQNDPVRGEATVTTDGGYARLLFRLEDEVEAKVTTSGTVLIVTFTKPVSIPVERISSRAPDYISAARLDPDGGSIRIALAKKVKVHTIAAAERLYVDLLPEKWVGLAPGLPEDVIAELSRRVREAEAQLRKQQLAAKPKTDATIRVKVGVQPTFVRYIFEMPELANVVPERSRGKLTLNFDQPIKFDLADAAATLPPSVERVDSTRERDAATVVFRLKGRPLVRSYREGHSIVIDIGVSPADKRAMPAMPAKPAAAAGDNGAKAAPPPTPPATVQKGEVIPDVPPDMAMADADEGAPTGKPPPTAAVLPAPTPPGEPAPAELAFAHPEAAPAKPADVPKTAPAPAAKPATAAPAPVAKPTPPPATKSAPSPAVEAAAQPSAPPVPPDMMAANKKPPKPDTKPEAVPAPTLPAEPDAPVTVALHRQGDNLRIDFPFAAPTPAAVFLRGRTLWAVFDSGAKLDANALTGEKLFRKASLTRGKDGEAILRLVLEQPKLASLYSEGTGWVLTVGDAIVEPTKPAAIARSIVGKGRSSITIPFADPRKLHRIADPDVGDGLMVITALKPARGFLKDHEFVELRALASTHGIVVQPLADDIAVELAADKVVISRPGGLSLSSSSIAARDNNSGTNFQPLVFDTQTWGFDRQAPFQGRQDELVTRAAMAPEVKRSAARFDLARFYLARGMAAEAKGVLDVATADEREASATGIVLKAIADVMMGRPEEALKELANPKVGDNADAPIWRAMAHALQGQWARAREEFKKTEVAVGALPIELQRSAKREMLRCSIEVKDFAGASTLLNDFETLNIPPDMTASIDVLRGRVEEGLGHNADALNAYRMAAASRDRPYAAQGHLRDIALRAKLGDLKHADVISQLEELTTAWRGDDTEAEGLAILAHLYTQDKRPRDAFHVMRTALLAHPNSDLTRKIQDEAAKTFDSLFMSEAGDGMKPIEALGLFYDYRELTPIGRRGDEMIRRLADRLVAVDLLDQAAELLQHQVDHRLQGAARAQVATKLATIYLMNHKPDFALAAIEKTRLSELAGDLREQRLLLESRALSDIGRHEVALEIIEGKKTPEAMRLRADILWDAKKWRPAGEAIELMLGERWKNFTPLNEQERADVLRGAIAYALADDQMGLNRFRDKYAAKMNDGPDRHAFAVVTTPIGSAAKEFRDVVNAIGNTRTLDAFLSDMRKRYPDKEIAEAPGASAPETKPAAGAPQTQAPKPEAKADAKPEAKADATSAAKPGATPAKADASPTGSILPPRRPRNVR